MTVVPSITITAEDIREDARQKGINPDKYRYEMKFGGDGYCHIYIGTMDVGQLIFEDHAKILVDALNKLEASK